MANTIKGIIVEIGGDTSGLQNALKKVNSATASLSKELRGINSLLKVDPSSTELWAQKQTVLNNEIKVTSQKLEELKQHQKDVNNSGQELTEEQQKQYRALQREIINTENQLKNLKLEASDWTIQGKKLEEVGNKIQNLTGKVNELGNKLTTRITLPLAALVTAGIIYNAEIERYTTAFATFLGDAKEAEKVVNNIKESAAKTPFDVTSLVQANLMLISTGENAQDAQDTIMALGDAISATGGSNEELERMAANLQQVKNAGKATTLDIKQFAYAGIDIYGILAKQTGKTTAEVKEMEVTYEDLTAALKGASKEGGKYFNAMENASKTLSGQTNALKSEFKSMSGELTESLMPVAKKFVSGARDLIKQFDNLSDSEKENIVRTGLLVAAIGPMLKIFGTVTSTIGGVVKGIGTFSQAVGVLQTGAKSTSQTVNTLASILGTLSNPLTIAALGITTLVTAITVTMKKAEEETKNSLSNMGNSASDFVTGIQTASSHLDSFNETLFTTTEEQQELEQQMDEIQKGITEIARTASEERREYTEAEIKQLDEYFEQLRNLKNRELEIQESIAKAITLQSTTNSQAFQGNLEEYKIQSQEWIKTAEEQRDKTVAIIKNGTTEEIALLNQRYGEEATLQNENYANEYNKIIEQQNSKIALANNEVAQVSQIYQNGYLERSKQEEGFYNTLKDYTNQQETLMNNHNKKIEQIKNDELWYVTNKSQAIQSENETFAFHQKEIWDKMYKDMDKSQEEQLGVWLANVAQTELYGGKIDDKTQKIVDSIIASYDSMPKGTREAMKNAMNPMLEEMEKKEPSLFAKATSIANGILTKLRKAFDEHSPSKKTRKIFEYLMEGAEKGLKDEENSLYKKVDNISDNVLDKLNNTSFNGNLGNINKSVIDQTKTIFTTPQITFNVQELDEGKLQQCFNYINNKFGSAY